MSRRTSIFRATTAPTAGFALCLAGAGAWVGAEADLPPALAAVVGALIGVLLVAFLKPAKSGSPPKEPETITPKPSTGPSGGLRAGYGREILERLPNPLILLDADGAIGFANDAAIETFERAILGAHFSRTFRTPALLEAIEAAFDLQEAREVKFDLVRAQERFMRASVRPLERSGDDWRDPEMAVLVLMEDHTQARRAEILHRDFVANASHELKTPLASVAGIIETLQGHAKADEEARERFLAIMATQAERMKRLVEGLLSLNRIELDEHVRPRGVIRLIDVARNIEAQMGPISEGRLHVDFTDAEAEVTGDIQQLSQVFLNLVDNALKYSEPDTQVRLRAAPDNPDRPEMIGLEVIDQGEGVAPEHVTRLTERFYRVSVSRSRERGGTGLGLAIVKHIVKRHRGELEIRSEPGEGSVFTVWLPRAADAEIESNSGLENRPDDAPAT